MATVQMLIMMLDFGALPAVDITTSRMGTPLATVVCEVVPCRFFRFRFRPFGST